MLCIPLKHFYIGLSSIYPNNVKKEVKGELIKYQELVCDILFERLKKTDMSTLLLTQLSNI